ncbi:MAG: M20/M25/M40 family metallo-hydrolase, partial [Clostridia bacterium]|nr:M20/M25/M40 family metallo-hydrolase [Clostridia bacterium]
MKEYVNVDRYTKTFQKSIQCKTVPHLDESQTDWAEFEKLHQVFEEAYPLLHKTCKKEVVGKAGLIYTWEGTDPSLDPIAIIGHQDVVPVPEETLNDWTYPPFDGVIADGCLW